MTQTERAEAVFGILHSLYNDIVKFDDEGGLSPAEGSMLAQDLDTFGDRGLVEVLRDQGNLILTQAVDQVATLLQLTNLDKNSLTPGANVRVILELSALACWLFDPGQNARTRVSRSLSRRFYDINQQKKVLALVDPDARDSDLDRQLQKLEERSLALGYISLRDGKGKLNGIATTWPGFTKLVKDVFDGEIHYRILSGLTHGNVPLLRQLGYTAPRVDSMAGVAIIERSVSPLYSAYLCKVSAVAFSKAATYKFRLFGWNSEKLSSKIDSVLESIDSLAI